MFLELPAHQSPHAHEATPLSGSPFTTLTYAWRSWRGFSAIAPDQSSILATRFLIASAKAGQGLFSPALDVRSKSGWLPVDVAMSARIVRRLLALPSPPSEVKGLIGPAINALLAAAPSVRHPDAWGALLHLLLDLQAQDAAGGRWEPTMKSLAIELVNAQDIAGTWTKKGNTIDVPACTAAVQAAWALDRLARARGGDGKLEHAATSAAEWAQGKQKTNGYFYSCTWSNDATTNPLLTELVDTAEGLLALGLARDHKHYRAAGLLTARELLKRTPSGQLAMGAWTSELNTERHRSALGTLRLADLCRLAATAPSPEQLGIDFAAEARRLTPPVAAAQVGTVAGWPDASGGVASTLPAWGRPYPFALSTEATASWLVSSR